MSYAVCMTKTLYITKGLKRFVSCRLGPVRHDSWLSALKNAWRVRFISRAQETQSILRPLEVVPIIGKIVDLFGEAFLISSKFFGLSASINVMAKSVKV